MILCLPFSYYPVFLLGNAQFMCFLNPSPAFKLGGDGAWAGHKPCCAGSFFVGYGVRLQLFVGGLGVWLSAGDRAGIGGQKMVLG